MSSKLYDAIVVGARCAGSPTAMLLARKGYKVLVVDRATFPSDTLSTHLIHPPGVTALEHWGLLDRVIASGCPPIRTYSFNMGPFAISGTPGPDGAVAYGPRRTLLDKILVDAAADAGAEIREGFTVERLLTEGDRVVGIRGHSAGGQAIEERTRVLVGADGLHSLVANAVRPEQYHEKPALEAAYYTYWSGLPMHGGFEAYDRGDRAWAAWPTNDGLTLIVVGWPVADFEANKADVERHYMGAFERDARFAERMRGAKREARFAGAAVPNFFRKPFGPGWALVGDAGYNKDPITAQGISDAFRDASLCAAALDAWLSGARSFDAAMVVYQAARDEQALPMYDYTCDFASFKPPTPEQRQLTFAIHRNQEAMDGFVRVYSGVVSAADFFSKANIERIFAASAARS